SRLKSSTASVPPGYSLRTFSNPITGPPDGASWGTGPADRDHGPGADLSEPRNAGRRPSLARRGDGAAAGHPSTGTPVLRPGPSVIRQVSSLPKPSGPVTPYCSAISAPASTPAMSRGKTSSRVRATPPSAG